MYYGSRPGDSMAFVMINFADFGGGVGPPGVYALGSFEVIVAPSPEPRQIQFKLGGYPAVHNQPVLVDTDLVAWAVALDAYLIRLTGDANFDSALTAADTIYIVNYVFKGGPWPYRVPAAGDTDCSGQVTSADIIRLVNHLFKGGPPPCDVEAECTIALEQWMCP